MESIAIIGMSCRFPGANGTDALWTLIRDGGDAISEVPPDRWDVDRYWSEDLAPGKMCTRRGGFLDNVDRFDAAFFGISPREANDMDPQQRIVLETAWEALEHAGIAIAGRPPSDTGVFLGMNNWDYYRVSCTDRDCLHAYNGTGTMIGLGANRLSYQLNLRGPSMTIDTACSSSLVSVHLACQSLTTGESSLAIAGGVNLILAPEVTIILSQMGLISRDGRCRSFAAGANGYVRSEGCGIVILQRLSDAQRERRSILAVIRASAVNHGGTTNGLIAPSGGAQQAVIRRALDSAGLRAGDLSLIEGHGTGTPLGDAIEWRALRAVMSADGANERSCAVGSIKSNIGHAESAAGIAGLIKVILALGHATIPASQYASDPNPYLRSERGPLVLAAESRPWPSLGAPRRAGVSAFGVGGTNAHLVVEEAPERPAAAPADDRAQYVLPLSAASESALATLIRRYAAFLAERPEMSLGDIRYTAACGRSHFRHRAAFVASTLTELQEQLEAGRSIHDRDEHADLFLRGVDLDWPALYASSTERIVTLPTYPFERRRFWFDEPNDEGPPREQRQRLRSRAASSIGTIPGGSSKKEIQ